MHTRFMHIRYMHTRFMHTRFMHPFCRLLAALALAAACGSAAAGILRVSIDTAGFGTASGYLDMQFGASAGGPLATATVDNVSGFGAAAVVESWGVETVAGGWRFRNDTANDLFQSVTFGGILAFDLAFDGGFDAAGGVVSPFILSAFDASLAPLGTFDPVNGALATFLWTPASSADGAGTVGHAIADPRVTVAAVPEPGQWLLMGTGLLALAAARRRGGVRRDV